MIDNKSSLKGPTLTDQANTVPRIGYIHDWQLNSWIAKESKPGDGIQV